MSAPRFEPNWKKIVPFAIVHVLAVAAVLLVPFSWRLVALAFALYLVRMFGTTAGYHRYFAHRAFKTSRPIQFLLGVVANLSLMRGPIDWVAAHRYHHKHSDLETDLHSPRRGFVWSHLGWFLSQEYARAALFDVRDLEKFPELVWLNRYYFVPSYALAIGLYVVGGWPWVAWGFLASTVFTWHAVFTINSLSHVFGSQRYETKDASKNNVLLALLTLGEGWHNNHHHDMQSAAQGFFWWEVDPTYYVLWGLEKLHVIRDLRRPRRGQEAPVPDGPSMAEGERADEARVGK